MKLQKHVKRLLTISLAGIMMIGASGCGSDGNDTKQENNGQESENNSTNQTENTDGEKEESNVNKEDLEVLSLSIMNPIFSASPLGTAVMDAYMENLENFANRELGVTLDITWEEPGFWDHLEVQSVYLAAGDYPDVFYIFQKPNLLEIGDDGFLVDLSEYEDSLTYFKAYMEADSAMYSNLLSSETGALYGLPDVYQNDTQTTINNYYLRFDSLQENEITPPESMEEIYEVCKKYKEIYPNSYPLASDSSVIDCTLDWMHTHASIHWDGDAFVFGPIDEEQRVKDSIIWLHKLYSEGLIDPEYDIMTKEQKHTKMLDNTIFFSMNNYADQINSFINNNDVYPGVQWGTMKQPTNLYGEPTWQPASMKRGLSIGGDHFTVINANTKEPEKVARLMDYAKYAPEMVDFVNWGIEGTTYTVNENGEYMYVDSIMDAAVVQNEMAQYGLGGSCRSGFFQMPQLSDAASASMGYIPVYNDGEYYEDTIYEFGDSVNTEEVINPAHAIGAPNPSFTIDEQDEISRIKTPVDTYVSETLTKFMIGDMDIEKEWDAFVSGIQGIGDIESIVELYNSKLQ